MTQGPEILSVKSKVREIGAHTWWCYCVEGPFRLVGKVLLLYAGFESGGLG